MSQQIINNFFPNNSLDIFDDCCSKNSSETELNNDMVYFNTSEKITNELTAEEKNNNLNKIPNIGNDKEKIINEIISDESSKKSSVLGRKRKGAGNKKSGHTKFADDNTRRKIKRVIISELHKFINKRIKILFKNNIGGGLTEKKLMILAQNQIAEAGIQFDKNFLEKKLKNIFSENITSRITMFSSERNKELIEELINDENEEINNYFRGLFDITFLECLIYFRDDNIYNEYLQGFPKFSDIKENFEKKEGINFTEHIMKYLQKYEEFLNNKKPRKNKK